MRLRRMLFYFHSDGGVTISGGEALVQADFAKEILQNRNTLESIPYWKPAFVVLIMKSKGSSLCGYIVCGCKMFTSKLHKQWTGLDNQQI